MNLPSLIVLNEVVTGGWGDRIRLLNKQILGFDSQLGDTVAHEHAK